MLIKRKWYALYDKSTKTFYAYTSYTKTKGKRHKYAMHRVIMGNPEGKQIDHKNHDTLDNRKQNLRICNASQNMANSAKTKPGTSIYKGVYFRKAKNPWNAVIRINKKKKHIGSFPTEELAATAYNEAAIKEFGEFAFLNVFDQPGDKPD